MIAPVVHLSESLRAARLTIRTQLAFYLAVAAMSAAWFLFDMRHSDAGEAHGAMFIFVGAMTAIGIVLENHLAIRRLLLGNPEWITDYWVERSFWVPTGRSRFRFFVAGNGKRGYFWVNEDRLRDVEQEVRILNPALSSVTDQPQNLDEVARWEESKWQPLRKMGLISTVHHVFAVTMSIIFIMIAVYDWTNERGADLGCGAVWSAIFGTLTVLVLALWYGLNWLIRRCGREQPVPERFRRREIAFVLSGILAGAGALWFAESLCGVSAQRHLALALAGLAAFEFAMSSREAFRFLKASPRDYA